MRQTDLPVRSEACSELYSWFAFSDSDAALEVCVDQKKRFSVNFLVLVTGKIFMFLYWEDL